MEHICNDWIDLNWINFIKEYTCTRKRSKKINNPPEKSRYKINVWYDNLTDVILSRHLNIKSPFFLLMIFPFNSLPKVKYFPNRRWNFDHQWVKLWHIQHINHWRHNNIHLLHHHDNSNRSPASHAARELSNQTLWI